MTKKIKFEYFNNIVATQSIIRKLKKAHNILALNIYGIHITYLVFIILFQQTNFFSFNRIRQKSK